MDNYHFRRMSIYKPNENKGVYTHEVFHHWMFCWHMNYYKVIIFDWKFSPS